MTHLGDITRIDGGAIKPVDVITFGSPCQDLSIAGKRAGLAGERSNLFLDAVRIIREMRCKTDGKYPAFAVWENVPGAFSSNKGEDFRRVLQELAALCGDTVLIPRPAGRWLTAGEIMGDGYSIAWRVMDAQYWGVPQRRRRIALVVDFGGQRAGEILFESAGVPGDFKPRGTSSQGATRGIAGGANLAERSLRGACAVYDCRGNGSGEIAQTITGDHQNRVTDYTAICIMGNVIDRNANCNGAGWCKDVSYTLNTVDRHAVMCMATSRKQAAIDNDLCGTLTGSHELPMVDYPVSGIDCRHFAETSDVFPTIQAGEGRGYTLNGIHAVRICTVVRRLTPLECERLQGYPDGWTEIPDYIDSRGKRRKASDSARYTALGNSIALPQWRYVLGNISRYLPNGATLGSLFDGIGGFPLVWEEMKGKGTAVWASEINEFCIAVTKYRFGG